MIFYFVGLFSLVFDFLFNSFLYNTIFIPLIFITFIVILEPYFINKKKYFIYCYVIGFLYDLIYFNSFFLQASLFLIIGFIVYEVNKNLVKNIFISLLEVVIGIIIYRILSFFFYVINGLVIMDFYVLFESIYRSILFNVFFFSVIYFVFKKIKFKSIK